MRNPGPLKGQAFIHREIFPVIIPVQFPVKPAQDVRQEGLAFFHYLMGLILKIGEHGLTVKGGPEIIEPLVQKKQPFLFRPGMFIQVMTDQLLIEGGGHLGAENAVPGIDKRLAVAAEPGVEGMAQLMGQGKDVLQGSGEI